jgi:tRNA (guanosine-2'-O-)-methyltransferase
MAEDRKGKIRRVIENRQEGIIVLEDIHDPHNAAAVWRSCDGFGFQKVYLIFEQEKRFNPKKIGKASSSSANKWLDFKIFRSTKECVEELKKEGYKIFATILDKEATNLQSTNFKLHKIAVMLGNEHRGLSEAAVKMADEKIYIPMKGMVQSFNLSVTAAIVMYEINRQRTGKSFGLSKEEKEEIGKRWR